MMSTKLPIHTFQSGIDDPTSGTSPHPWDGYPFAISYNDCDKWAKVHQSGCLNIFYERHAQARIERKLTTAGQRPAISQLHQLWFFKFCRNCSRQVDLFPPFLHRYMNYKRPTVMLMKLFYNILSKRFRFLSSCFWVTNNRKLRVHFLYFHRKGGALWKRLKGGWVARISQIHIGLYIKIFWSFLVGPFPSNISWVTNW